MKLTKQEIVIRLSEEAGITQQQASDLVHRIFGHIIGTPANGGRVEIRNFGRFGVRVDQAKKWRKFDRPDPPLLIPSRPVVRFLAGTGLKNEVRKLTPERGQ